MERSLGSDIPKIIPDSSTQYIIGILDSQPIKHVYKPIMFSFE